MALRTAKTADSPKESPLAYSRIVVKAWTNVLTGVGPRLDRKVMAALVRQVAGVRELGAQVVLVTSGAIAAGREAIGEPRIGRGVPLSQMLAAVGQSRLMHSYQGLFSRYGTVVAQALLTRPDVEVYKDQENILVQTENTDGKWVVIIEFDVVLGKEGPRLVFDEAVVKPGQGGQGGSPLDTWKELVSKSKDLNLNAVGSKAIKSVRDMFQKPETLNPLLKAALQTP